MKTEPRCEIPSPHEQLNEIARQCEADDECPIDGWGTDVRNYGQILHDQLEDRIRPYVEETTLTPCEAEIWVLCNTYNGDYVRLTDRAVALILSTPNTGFGNYRQADDEDSAVDHLDVKHIYDVAHNKCLKAHRFVGEVSCPNRNETLRSPQITWLDRDTLQRLNKRRRSEEETVDEIITRILDESEVRRPLDEVIKGYRQARGEENVLQISIEIPSFEYDDLRIKAYTSFVADLPKVVAETDVVTICGKPYELRFEEERSEPLELGQIPLYVSEGIAGSETLELDAGLAAVQEQVSALLERT